MAWDFDLEKNVLRGIDDDERERWVAFHRRRERCWFEAARHVMSGDPCDLTAIIFDGVDKIQHACWPLLDPDFASDRSSPADRRVRDLCLEYFRDVDGYLAEIARLAGPDARLFVVSDHGFGPTLEVFRVNVWLHEQGYLEWAALPSKTDAAWESIARRVDSNFALVDWQKTVAYAQTPSSNGIVLRTLTESIGGSRAAYESLREEITAGLLEVMSPSTGQPVVSRVIPREEAFPGVRMDAAPDLYLELADHGFVSIKNMEPVVAERPDVTGTHRPNGIMIAAGPGIGSGRRIEDLSVVDVAPLLLHSLGTEIPADMDGRFPDTMFEASSLADSPPLVRLDRASTADDVAGTDDSSATDDWDLQGEPDDEAGVLQRLAALGYLELDD